MWSFCDTSALAFSAFCIISGKNRVGVKLLSPKSSGRFLWKASRSLFFNKPAHTTTIPAQLSLKYGCKLVPISLERKKGPNFEMTIHEPYKIEKTGNEEEDTKNITLKINQVIEKMIIKNPKQWIWSHNRWK